MDIHFWILGYHGYDFFWILGYQTIVTPAGQTLKEQLDQKCVAGPQLLMEDLLSFINFITPKNKMITF